MLISKDEMNIRNYLDQLAWEYAQLCQRKDGSIYGIRSGLQCRNGTPISYNPNLARQVRKKEKARVTAIVTKAKAIGLTNKDIKQVAEEVKSELGIKNLKGTEALRLFAKKANSLAKEKSKPNQVGGFKTPSPYKNYNIQKDISDSSKTELEGGMMGKVYETKGPPPGILKEGKIGENEAAALEKLKGTGIAPDFHGLSLNSEPKTIGPDWGGHVREAKGYLAMSKMEGEPLSRTNLDTNAKKDEVLYALIKARRDIHTAGVAHNDMHSGNVFVKPDGSIGFVDFGLSQVSYKAALIEAMGAADGNDWQFGRTVGYRYSPLRKESAEYAALAMNIKSAKTYMENYFGVTWKGLEIRSPDSDIDNSPVGSLSDDQIKELLDIIYSGF